jgi:hypothetical protein
MGNVAGMTDISANYQGITYVIPCGGQKLDRPAKARDLYTGSMFVHTLAAVEAEVAQLGEPARVLILSAKHGLVELDTVLAPYEQRMDKPGSITAAEVTAQAQALGIDWDGDEAPGSVYALLPRPYFARLDAALRALDVYAANTYDDCTRGIGEQKRVNVNVARPIGPRTRDAIEAEAATTTDPQRLEVLRAEWRNACSVAITQAIAAAWFPPRKAS